MISIALLLYPRLGLALPDYTVVESWSRLKQLPTGGL